ncbi:uncharacterized protein A4U43_C08F3660 [Asparagus officinalis]|nr:uncharacterized protein A4U43_C08F3660 [Asparagus officinalis]
MEEISNFLDLFKDRSPPRDFAHLFRSAPIKSGLFRFLAILDSEARLGLELWSASQIDAVIFAAKLLVDSSLSISGPSSGDFDSGVDNQQAPSKYIVWYPDVKTHVLPLYAVTVKMELDLGAIARDIFTWDPMTSMFIFMMCFNTSDFSGLWLNVTRFVSQLSAVPLVALSGFGLYELGFLSVAKCIEIELPHIILLIIFSQVTGNQVAKITFHNAVIRGSDAIPSVIDNKRHRRQQPEQRTLP